MTIKVSSPLLYGPNNHKLSVDVDADTPMECVKELVGRFPELTPVLFGNRTKLRNDIFLFHNKKLLTAEELNIKLKNGDELDILPLLEGG